MFFSVAMQLSNLSVIFITFLASVQISTSISNKQIEELKRTVEGSVFVKGTLDYEKRRLVHNALCEKIFPDLIVVPKSTYDVSNILKVSSKYNIPISVRSGGHSYTCTSIKQGGIHIDLRSMNKIELVSSHMAILGPGSTWNEVLDKIPPTDFTMLHGQCRNVGVGGYIAGGGMNFVGTYEKFGTAAEHVLKYTLVTANGTILHISEGNTTVINPNTKTAHQINDHGLNFAIRGN